MYIGLLHRIFFYNQESPILGLASRSDFSFNITVCTYFTQSSSLFSHIFHMIFIMYALLTSFRSCIPNPPLSFGWQIVDHLTLAFLELPHKKNFRIFSTSLMILLGKKNDVVQHLQIAIRTELISWNRPP